MSFEPRFPANILQGGQGDDIVAGGSGYDTFLWRAADLGGNDAVRDFALMTVAHSGQDRSYCNYTYIDMADLGHDADAPSMAACWR